VLERAVHLREAGLSTREISRLMGIPQSTIGDWVKGIVPLEYVELDDPVPTEEDLRLQRLRSFCTSCHQTKPWAQFWARTKWPDGTMRLPHSHSSCIA
jgi:hypothetical protein